MVARIAQITLVVSNQAKSLEFYTRAVGFETKADVPLPGGRRWVTVGPKDQELELALWEVGSAVDPAQTEWSKHWTAGRSPPIVLRVSDCEAVYRELSARGVPFPQSPKRQPWGTAATFTDPDGNLFSISQLPTVGPASK